MTQRSYGTPVRKRKSGSNRTIGTTVYYPAVLRSRTSVSSGSWYKSVIGNAFPKLYTGTPQNKPKLLVILFSLHLSNMAKEKNKIFKKLFRLRLAMANFIL